MVREMERECKGVYVSVLDDREEERRGSKKGWKG